MHECTLTKEFLTPKTVEGHGTEAMALSMRQEQAIWPPPCVVKATMIADTPLPRASDLIPQSIEEIFQLKRVDV